MKPDVATEQGTAAFVRLGRGLGWVIACTAAGAIGIALARPLAELVRQPLSPVAGGLPTVALFGALFGGCLGVGQALTRWGRSGSHRVWWILATSVSGAVGYVLGVKLATALTDPIRGHVLVYASEALGYLVLGAVLGMFFGVVQGALQRTNGHVLVGRIVLSTLGWALGFVVAAGVGLLITTLPSVTVRDLLFGGLAGLTAGCVEALILTVP